MITISDLGDTLITYSLDVRYTSLKICVDLMIRFNNTGVDENVSIFYNIGNTYNFEIGFRLEKTRSHDVLQINDIYILDVTLLVIMMSS